MRAALRFSVWSDFNQESWMLSENVLNIIQRNQQIAQSASHHHLRWRTSKDKVHRHSSNNMHGYPVMQVVQYSVPPCTWVPPPPSDNHRPPSAGRVVFSILFFYIFLFSISHISYELRINSWKFIIKTRSSPNNITINFLRFLFSCFSCSRAYNNNHCRRQSAHYAATHNPGVRKYVVWCLICGGISCLLGVMFLGVYFLVRSYTSTVGYFETVPTFVPATLVCIQTPLNYYELYIYLYILLTHFVWCLFSTTHVSKPSFTPHNRNSLPAN